MTHEELSQQTKSAYAHALRNLLIKKPLQKISIGELSTACNKNRNTFYYHFTDIYDLLRWMLQQECDYVLEQIKPYDSTEDALGYILKYIDNNKSMIRKIYESMGHDEMRRNYYDNFYALLNAVIRGGEKKMNVSVSDEFRDFLTAFYTEAFAGMIVQWIKKEDAETPEEFLHKLFFISKHSVPKLLRDFHYEIPPASSPSKIV